jgi:hypothetical protein
MKSRLNCEEDSYNGELRLQKRFKKEINLYY